MRRFKDIILKDKKFIREVAIILIVGIIINAFCFFTSFIYSKAASSSLPYIPQGENTYYNAEEVTYILDWLNRIPEYDPNAPTIVFLGSLHTFYDYNNNIDCKAYFVYQPIGTTLPTTWSSESDPNFHPNFSNFVLYSNDYLTLGFESGHKFTVTNRTIGNSTLYDGWECTYNETLSNQNKKFFGDSTPISVNNSKFQYTYLANYPVYCNMNFLTIDGTTQQGVWLSPGREPIIMPGEFTDLPNLEELLDNISNSFTGGSSGTTNTPDQNKTDIQNFADFFNNLQSFINSNLNNLGQNIKGWFDNLQKKLTDVANAISSNIYNGFSTLMANIKEFFGPKLDAIIEKLDYITEPFDQEEINDFIESSYVYSDITSIQSSLTSFTGSLTGVSEPSSYSITLHIEDIGILHQEQPYILSFDILNNVKVYIRGFLWCFCTYGLFISIVDSLANYINGGGGEDD